MKGTLLESAPTKSNLCKWQDEKGQWHVTDQPPKGDIIYNNLEYGSDANIVPSIPIEED